MIKFRKTFMLLTILLAFGGINAAAASSITTILGNATPGFNDGDTPAVFPDVINAQSGQPAPFDAGIGSDVIAGDNFNATWTFNYTPFPAAIASASISLGILDHDSMATGSQVDMFTVGGFDLSAELDSAFEFSGGGDGEYNVYTLALDPSVFPALDGSVEVTLSLLGPGLQTALPFLGGGVSETVGNGAHLIYSSLTVNPVPVPAALPLFLSALAALGLFGRRVRRKED